MASRACIPSCLLFNARRPLAGVVSHRPCGFSALWAGRWRYSAVSAMPTSDDSHVKVSKALRLHADMTGNLMHAAESRMHGRSRCLHAAREVARFLRQQLSMLLYPSHRITRLSSCGLSPAGCMMRSRRCFPQACAASGKLRNVSCHRQSGRLPV